ncbi:unnamed protein product, partial [Ectocarpus fasciculatus]
PRRRGGSCFCCCTPAKRFFFLLLLLLLLLLILARACRILGSRRAVQCSRRLQQSSSALLVQAQQGGAHPYRAPPHEGISMAAEPEEGRPVPQGGDAAAHGSTREELVRGLGDLVDALLQQRDGRGGLVSFFSAADAVADAVGRRCCCCCCCCCGQRGDAVERARRAPPVLQRQRQSVRRQGQKPAHGNQHVLCALRGRDGGRNRAFSLVGGDAGSWRCAAGGVQRARSSSASGRERSCNGFKKEGAHGPSHPHRLLGAQQQEGGRLQNFLQALRRRRR